jgi:hypothetical protein
MNKIKLMVKIQIVVMGVFLIQNLLIKEAIIFWELGRQMLRVMGQAKIFLK